jgi:2',3'-cyclic-nucleotide 2'-phosphodiesterase (5'-nucleotidase family)
MIPRWHFALALFALTLLVPYRVQAATVTFMHYNDLHAHLTPHLDLVEENGQVVYKSRGGIARLATAVKKIRAETPNSVLMNVGDTYHGGVEALYTQGNAIADPVNALGIDIGTPGNWDFAYGPPVFRLRYEDVDGLTKTLLEAAAGGEIKPAGFVNLAANLFFADTGDLVLTPSALKTIGGVKVGFVGLTSDIVAKMDERLATNFSFTQGETAYRDLINSYAQTLRSQGAQLVVVMSELGIHKDYRLADVINSGAVDVFFSAHTHEATFTPLKGKSGALVVEAGNDGWLGRMDVTVESGAAPAFAWKLLPLDASVAEDAAMKSLVDAARAPFLVADPNLVVPTIGVTLELHQPIDAVIGHIDAPLDRKNVLESRFNNAWTDTVRALGNTQVGMASGFRFDAPLPAAGGEYEDGHVADGAVTVEDVYRYFPVPFTYATATTSGENLRTIIETNLTEVFSRDGFKQAGGWGDGWSGLSLVYDLSAADGARVKSFALASGTAISATSTLSVTGCRRPNEAVADAICSYTGFSNIVDVINPETGNPIYPQELFIKAMQSGGLASNGSRDSITDAAATPLWPAQDAVQPLMVRVTSGAALSTSALTYDNAAKAWRGKVTLTNTGSSPLRAPLKIVIDQLSAGSTVLNATGTYYGLPYLALTGSLAAGASVSVDVVVSGSKKAAPSFTPRAYTGGV